GLGLAICKRLVNLMGGDISVESQRSGGTIFSFDVRLQINISEQPTPPILSTEQSLSNLQVLLVEDNQINRELALVTLQRRGISVDIAEDGQQALDRLEEKHYDAVLMDLRMPNMDGFEAIGHIRSNPGTRHLPVIAVSASVMDEEAEQALASGFDEFLGKPIDYPQLLQTLSRLTQRSSSGRHETLNLTQSLASHQSDSNFLYGLLQECIDMYSNAHQLLQQHIDAGDVQAAEHLLHNIASVAGGFGGDDLMQIGRQMERQLRDNPAALRALDCVAFREKLTQFMDAIQAEIDQYRTREARLAGESLAD
ncbi:MAG: response regulator, partial [Pseudomonadota bacterium]